MWFPSTSSRRRVHRLSRPSSPRMHTVKNAYQQAGRATSSNCARRGGVFHLQQEIVAGLFALTTLTFQWFLGAPWLPPADRRPDFQTSQPPPPPTQRFASGPPSPAEFPNVDSKSTFPLCIALGCAVVTCIVIGAGSTFHPPKLPPFERKAQRREWKAAKEAGEELSTERMKRQERKRQKRALKGAKEVNEDVMLEKGKKEKDTALRIQEQTLPLLDGHPQARGHRPHPPEHDPEEGNKKKKRTPQ